MTDVLIRDVPDDVVSAIEARARRVGLSRTEYLRRQTMRVASTSDELRTGLRRPPLASMPVEYLTPTIEDRAVEVQQLLADRGHHRDPAVPDLWIAATAELGGLVVLHIDKDFDLIADVTGQQVERLPLDEQRVQAE